MGRILGEGAIAEVSGDRRNPAWICRDTRPKTQDISISLSSFILKNLLKKKKSRKN